MLKYFSTVVGILIIVLISGLYFSRDGISFISNTDNAILKPTKIILKEDSIPKSVVVIQGQAIYTHNGTDTILVSSGSAQLLSVGDSIQTPSASVAIVDFTNGTVMRISPESRIIFSKQENTSMTLLETVGSIYVRFKGITGVRESFNVETPTLVANVRGTKLAVFVDTRGTTKIVVSEDQVQVFRKTPSPGLLKEKTIQIPEGKQVEVKQATVSGEVVQEPLVVTETSLTPIQQLWVDFNKEADQIMDSKIANQSDLKVRVSRFITQRTALEAAPSPTATPANNSSSTSLSVPELKSMPGIGYSTGFVKTDTGSFTLRCIGAAKNTTRVITDAANDSDCKNDCPVRPLADYVSSNGGFAGMNGMYFCPADYPACSEKKNSFDTLFFNSRTKQYLNSDNNVYSSLPFLVVFGDGNTRFVSRTVEWGRDTSIQAGVAGNPLLIRDGTNVVNEYTLEDRQKNVKAPRGAFVQEGENVYLCVIGGATVPDSADVYSTIGADNAINIDGGGSTALYVNGGYKFGPGRQIPNAIIFAVR